MLAAGLSQHIPKPTPPLLTGNRGLKDDDAEAGRVEREHAVAEASLSSSTPACMSRAGVIVRVRHPVGNPKRKV
jgi:hypothetical protein